MAQPLRIVDIQDELNNRNTLKEASKITCIDEERLLEVFDILDILPDIDHKFGREDVIRANEAVRRHHIRSNRRIDEILDKQTR